jgi:hypothetical protein
MSKMIHASNRSPFVRLAGLCRRHSVRACGLLPAALALWSGTAALWAAAPPAASPKPPVTNRWLFIVETSGSMQERTGGIERILGGLLANGAGSQMRQGDTVGLWTYNDQLNVGQFPLQTWTPTTGDLIARRMVDYLKQQKFEKRSRFDKVLPELQRVITNSEFLTAIVISDGMQKIKGTPFDHQINTAYDTWKKEQQKAFIPFITVLRADHGHLTHAAVTAPPWPLDMPPLPAELTNQPPVQVVAPAAASTPPARSTPPPPKPAPPQQPKALIITGKKPPTTETANPSEWVITNLPPAQVTTPNNP